MTKTNNLPYFNINKPKNSNFNDSGHFLCRKFLPSLKKKFPCHYLVCQDLRRYLKFIKEVSKKYPYFLRLDIEKYFPSINHQILASMTPFTYKQLTNKPSSRRMQRLLKYNLPLFFNLSPCHNQGIPIGSGLSHILAGIYLLKLDLSLNLPFLRFTDDYLVFGKNQQQLNKVLSNTITPVLMELGLSINIKKLYSGKFHQDKLIFFGFEFYASYIRISPDKVAEFKQRIKEITYLTRHKPESAIIKLLNNQVLGSGHYYKHASCKNTFQNLDAFIRARLRRYILRNRDHFPKTGNLLLTNSALKNLGLKSLTEIKEKFDRKFQQKISKSAKIKGKTGHHKPNSNWAQLEQISDKYKQNQILNELKELTSLMKKLEKRTGGIEKKLNE